METLKNISVTVTYQVGLEDIKAPKKVIDQLQKLFDSGRNLITGTTDEIKYPDAMDWLTENIREIDCTDWECEINDFEIN